MVLSITMTDSNADGWNGNVLGVKQNNAVVGTFGSSFTSAGSSGPVSITVSSELETLIVVTEFGSAQSELGFIVRFPNGTVIHERTSGVGFAQDDILFSFCPSETCLNRSYSTLTIAMTDSGSDGWNGNILGIRQNNEVMGTFGSTFTSGSSAAPLFITVKANSAAQIMVAQLGNKTG